jgi:NADPH-dependent curcumin reductase CurA
MVCQLGKIVGAKVFAIAGSDDKCEWLEKDIGVDKALNYKSATFVEDFKSSVGYLDVYFDNGKCVTLQFTPYAIACARYR